MKSINPHNNELINQYDELSRSEIDNAINNANKAYEIWRWVSFSERSKLFTKLAENLESDKTKLAQLMTDEMGKPIQEGRAEVDKCAWVCRYYAENAQEFLADKNIQTDFTVSKISYNPLGVILAVMPWNYPLWQVFRFAVPTLMAGNTALLKHASNVSGCSLAIENLFKKSGFASGIFTSLLIGSDKVEDVLKNDSVKAVSLTGSTKAGKSVAECAGRHLKKSVLELGGSDAYLILDDKNLEETVELCAKSRLLNSGQSCIAAKRFIVLEEIHESFVSKLKSTMESYIVGNPSNETTQIGPIARKDLRDDLHEVVRNTIDSGAKLIMGGEIPKKDGSYYPVTILDGVEPGMPAYSEELFGPVATVIQAKDIDHAIEIANNSNFGLGSAVFTSNQELGLKIASEKLEAGAAFVNDFVKSDPRLPFGGIKESGYGRELSSNGIHEFVNIKTVCLR